MTGCGVVTEKGESHDNYTNTTWLGNGIEYLDMFNDVG